MDLHVSWGVIHLLQKSVPVLIVTAVKPVLSTVNLEAHMCIHEHVYTYRIDHVQVVPPFFPLSVIPCLPPSLTLSLISLSPSLFISPSLPCQIVRHILILTIAVLTPRDHLLQCPLQGLHSLAPHPPGDPFHPHLLDTDIMADPLCPPPNIPLVPRDRMGPHLLEHLDPRPPQNFSNQDPPTNH